MRVFLFLLAGCAGPPLKELPVLEAPPPELPDEKPREPSPPASETQAPAPPPRLEGAWRSRLMQGPGSATYRQINFVFETGGPYLGVALGQKAPVVIHGTWAVQGGMLVLHGEDGTSRTWGCAFDDASLTLKEGECTLVLERIR